MFSLSWLSPSGVPTDPTGDIIPSPLQTQTPYVLPTLPSPTSSPSELSLSLSTQSPSISHSSVTLFPNETPSVMLVGREWILRQPLESIKVT